MQHSTQLIDVVPYRDQRTLLAFDNWSYQGNQVTWKNCDE